MSVEHLQNQNTEKDQVNRTLSDKLEALVRCGASQIHGSWLRARLLGPWWIIPSRLGAVVTVHARLSTVTFTSVPFHRPCSKHKWKKPKPEGLSSAVCVEPGLGSLLGSQGKAAASPADTYPQGTAWAPHMLCGAVWALLH